MENTRNAAGLGYKEREKSCILVMAASERGIGHIAKGLPNQDAYAVHQSRESGEPTIIVVSDGVSNCPRSEVGSSFAVQTALDAVKDFCAKIPGNTAENLSERVKADLVPNIIAAWRRAVEQHIRDNPFSHADQERLQTLRKEEKTEFYRKKLGHMYATTLVLVATTEGYTIALQIGDGDIAFVNKDGTKLTRPLNEPNELGDETVALSSKDAERKARIFIAGPGRGGMVMV